MDGYRDKAGRGRLHRLRHLLPSGVCGALLRDCGSEDVALRRSHHFLCGGDAARLGQSGPRVGPGHWRKHRSDHRAWLGGGLHSPSRPHHQQVDADQSWREGCGGGLDDGWYRPRGERDDARVCAAHVRLPAQLLRQDGGVDKWHGHTILVVRPALLPATLRIDRSIRSTSLLAQVQSSNGMNLWNSSHVWACLHGTSHASVPSNRATRRPRLRHRAGRFRSDRA
mmetsp:Transcript_42042/g.123068  ORF Transcript_42042/g.123068 Transcript_42042/m.123068 type:complete len:225 (-) Transcript_42042:226-900(-)